MFMASTPTAIGKAIADLISRGWDRGDIAKQLRIKKSHLSGIEKGNGYLADEKIPVLADMLGNDDKGRWLFVQKWKEWLEREKGISLSELN